MKTSKKVFVVALAVAMAASSLSTFSALTAAEDAHPQSHRSLI